MASVHQIVKLIEEYYYNRLSPYEKRFIKNISCGLAGLGDVSDQDVLDYISEKQVNFIKKLGKRFLIRETTEI